jgi:hypothetical protein
MRRVLEYMWVTWIAIAGAGLAISVLLAHVREKRFSFALTAVHFLIGIASVASGLLFILEGASERPLFVTIREYAGRTLTVIVGVVMVSEAPLTILVAY